MTANLVACSRASKEFSLLEESFFPRARNDRIFLEDSSKDSLIVTSLIPLRISSLELCMVQESGDLADGKEKSPFISFIFLILY